MPTQCNPEPMLFARLDRRDVVADFGGGAITSDAGALLLGALAHTELERATCGTLRLKLMKIGAQVRGTVRRIRVAMTSACPYAGAFALAHARLCR